MNGVLEDYMMNYKCIEDTNPHSETKNDTNLLRNDWDFGWSKSTYLSNLYFSPLNSHLGSESALILS